MKCFNKKIMLLSLIVLLGYGKGLFGYTFTVANMTRRDVKVQLYWSWKGALNKEPRLIKSFETHEFSWKFPNSKFGLCLTRIMVSTEQEGEWLEPKEATIQIVTDEQLSKLVHIEVVGDIVAQALRWWGVSMCRDRDFILITDPESEEISTITTI